MDRILKVHDSADYGAVKPMIRPKRVRQAGDSSNDLEHGEPSKPATSPPLTVGYFLDWAVFLLICGFAAAKGYSCLFGPSNSEIPKSPARALASSEGANLSTRFDRGTGSSAAPGFAGSGLDSSTSGFEEIEKAKSADDDARRPETETKTVLDIDRGSLLSSRRLRDGPIAEALWTGRQGVHFTLRLVLNGAESRLDGMFEDQPLAEASARESLGMAFFVQGAAARAIKQFERALALRETAQGLNHPDSAACRKRLAIACRRARLRMSAGPVFDEDVTTPAYAAALAARGTSLIVQHQPAEAVIELRESLIIRENTQPDDWTTFDTRSMLGEALSVLQEFSEAEPLLLSGYEGMARRANMIPPQDKHRLARARERLVELYEAMGNREEAARWRKQRQLPHAASDPPGAPPAP
jgi:tetratricopeptide (TPR) repeat protein